MKLLEDNLLEGDWKGRRLEGLKGTLDPDVVAGRVGRDVNWKGRCCWKGWKGRRLEQLEWTLDPDVVDGRVGRDDDWKGRWIRTLLLEGDWKGRRLEGLEGMLLMEGLDVVVDCSD